MYYVLDRMHFKINGRVWRTMFHPAFWVVAETSGVGKTATFFAAPASFISKTPKTAIRGKWPIVCLRNPDYSILLCFDAQSFLGESANLDFCVLPINRF